MKKFNKALDNIYVYKIWIFIIAVLFCFPNFNFQCLNEELWDKNAVETISFSNNCSIEVLDDLTQLEFIERYAYNKPFILRNKKQNEKFRHLTSRSYLLNNYGNKIIRLSSANTYSYQKKDVTLKYYFENYMFSQNISTLGNETYYWFGDNNYTEWETLFDDYSPPHLHLPNMHPAYSFGIAAAGTGVPFHFHGAGFSEVIYGRKLWFLYPPEITPSFDPNKSTLQWYLNEYLHLSPSQLPLQCSIQPGEVLYFPNHWWHATLNLEASVFISTFLG